MKALCNRLTVIAVLAVVLIIAFSGCGSDNDALNRAQLEKIKNDCVVKTEELRMKLLSEMPQQYTALLSQHDTGSASGDAAGTAAVDYEQIIAEYESEKLDMLRPIAVQILKERLVYVKAVADDNSVALAEQAANDIISQMNSAQTVADLYNCLLSADGRLFECVEAEITEDFKDKAKVFQQIYVDGNGDTWICIHTNFVLPGFKDSDKGFSLQLLLENGEKAYAMADSLYNYENIMFDGTHSVRFNITRMLGDMTADDFFAGRNRVVFSAFKLDNSICFSQDFYRMSNSDIILCSSEESYLTLVCICAQYS